MSKTTLTKRVEELENNFAWMGTEHQKNCLSYLSVLMDSECHEFAINQLKDPINWISVIDRKKLGAEGRGIGIKQIDRRLYCLTPSAEEKYNKFYYEKLEQMLFGKDPTSSEKGNWFKNFINKIKRQ